MATRRKQKNFLSYFTVVSAMAALCFVGYIAYLWWKSPEIVHYPQFGITIPSGYEIHGIDVSRYQERISWEDVKEMNVRGIRIHFAFIKATEGTSLTDPFFKRNWKRSAEAGVIRGAYHFFIPWKKGRDQAEHFLDKVELKPGDLPPVLDIEQAGRVKPEVLRREAKIWLDMVEQQYGVKPIIYTGAEFYKRYLKGHFDEYPLWVAHYLQPYQPRISRDWSFWQHSEKGRVNGILSQVDFNVFNGDSVMFRSLLVP